MPAFQNQVAAWLKERIQHLPGELGLGKQSFFCGISQVAIGADTAFSNVCGELGIPHRIFLPQHRDEYLGAVGSDQRPDFTPEEKTRALELLARPNVIQIQVMSHAAERRQRFHDTQLEMVKISDVMICLVRPGQRVSLVEPWN